MPEKPNVQLGRSEKLQRRLNARKELVRSRARSVVKWKGRLRS